MSLNDLPPEYRGDFESHIIKRVETVLLNKGIEYKRECNVFTLKEYDTGGGAMMDFFLPEYGTAVECKIGSSGEIKRGINQCKRYISM